MDFTLKTYNELLRALKGSGYKFYTFLDHFKHQNERIVVLRHDVDRLPVNALIMAELEIDSGIKSSFYFRAVKQSFSEEIIKKITGMGHEVGYHYENLPFVARYSGVRQGEFAFVKRRQPGLRQKSEVRREEKETLYKKAILDFEKNLEKFREIVPVKTICMHGSPTSKYDSRYIWGTYDYRDFGIIGEPYFDIDFSKVLYLTDTGRRWDGEKFNIRDKVIKKSEVRSQKSESTMNEVEQSERSKQMIFSNIPHLHSTYDIIDALKKNLLPDQIMINTHPQRWTNDPILWTKELVWQNAKNLIKRFYI